MPVDWGSVEGAPDVASLDQARGLLPGVVGQGNVELLVGADSARRRLAGARCRMWSGEIPARAFIRMSAGVYVCSPEFCFVQLAGDLGHAPLVSAGYELTAGYRLSSEASGSQLLEREPIATPGTIEQAIRETAGARGHERAALAIKHVLGGAASPKESETSMLMTLRSVIGGYGLDLPVLNHLIPIDGRVAKRRRKRYFVADLCWPDKKVIVEYYGKDSHPLGRQKDDIAREELLSLMGYVVIPVVWGQLSDAREFDQVVHLVAKALGKRIRKANADVWTRRYQLRQEILTRGDRWPQ